MLPDTILGSILVEEWRSDSGITIVTGVSQWTGIKAGNNFTQGTGGAQPTYNATDAQFGGKPSLSLDGTDDIMSCATLTPTYPAWYWLIFTHDWVNGRFLLGNVDASAGQRFFQGTGTPILRMNAGASANDNGGLAINTPGRGEIYFSNSTSDYSKLITTTVTGASASNSVCNGRQLGGTTGANFAKMKIAHLLVCNALPSAAQRAALDVYATSRYGSGLV